MSNDSSAAATTAVVSSSSSSSFESSRARRARRTRRSGMESSNSAQESSSHQDDSENETNQGANSKDATQPRTVGWGAEDEARSGTEDNTKVKRKRKGLVSKLFGSSSQSHSSESQQQQQQQQQDDSIIPEMDDSTKWDYEEDEADRILANIPTLQDHSTHVQQGVEVSPDDDMEIYNVKVQGLRELEESRGQSGSALALSSDGIDLSVLSSVLYDIRAITEPDEPWTEQKFRDVLYETARKSQATVQQ